MTRDEAITVIRKMANDYAEPTLQEAATVLEKPSVSAEVLAELKAAYDHCGQYSYIAVGDKLKAIIERLAPLPKVEWVDGVWNSMADVDGWSMLTHPIEVGDGIKWVVHVRNTRGVGLFGPDDGYVTRDGAKHAAEARLHKLMRGTP